jgi:phenylalanyl-tRNA synthetase beta subunit
MRRSLLPNLLMATARNRHQGSGSAPSRSAMSSGATGKFASDASSAACSPARCPGGLSRGPRQSFYDAKGVVEALLGNSASAGSSGRADLSSFLHPGKAALVRVRGGAPTVAHPGPRGLGLSPPMGV